MFKKSKPTDLGKIKKETVTIVDGAVERQRAWRADKRKQGLANAAAAASDNKAVKKTVTTTKKTETVSIAADANSVSASTKAKTTPKKTRKNILSSYWFPILCALAVVLLIVWAVLAPNHSETTKVLIAPVPEPITNTIESTDTVDKADASKKSSVSVVEEKIVPTFDLVRIEKGGRLVIAGRWLPHSNVSILINGKIVVTEMTNKNGEFVYAPTKEYAAGNYTIRLLGVEQELKSTEDVFVYIAGKDNPSGSLSLLMAKDGSKLLQSPATKDGDLVVSKIDYLKTGRIVVEGRGLPRLRVSMDLNDKELGFAHVSDHKNFGLGADVGELKAGTEYTLTVKMHDGSGNLVANFDYKFTMPTATGNDDTYYTVRRDDALWIIARNFLGRGVLFSVIVKENNIKNPDLIYPKQVLKIPIKE